MAPRLASPRPRQQLAMAGRPTQLHHVAGPTLDGVITDLKMEVGQVVAPGQTIASLAHLAETEIVVDVPENHLADVKAAENVDIAVWSLPGTNLQAERGRSVRSPMASAAPSRSRSRSSIRRPPARWRWA